MTAVKASQAEAVLKSPDPRLTAFLLYGPDAGLVSERAQTLARCLAARDAAGGEILRLDDSDLEANPDRLSVELGTISLFGGRKIVRASAGRRINAAALKPLVESGALAGVLIVEAGNLRPDEAMRTLFERSQSALAIPCYMDEIRDLEQIVREMLAAEHLSITPDARELLVSRLGADRTMTRGEVEKLALYARGKTEIDAADVEAIVGDASELAIDRILTAAASGDARRTATELARALAAGENAQGIILAADRYFQRLHRVRAALDAGRSFDEAVRTLRPALHFRQKDALAAQCRAWTTARLSAALMRIASEAKSARLAGPLDEALAERLLLALALMAKGRP